MLNRKKIIYLTSIFFLIILLFISGKTLARFVNRNNSINIVWDGTIAESYRKGTGEINDPYIISNGSELAYFANQSLTNDYSNTYFELRNDIILNDGILNYNTDNITYTLNDTLYYIKEYTNEYYDNSLFTGDKVENINIFNSINNFNGFFNGNSYTIYGLYITSNIADNLGLFTNLSGNITNLNIENALIYGGIKTGGISSNSSNSSISNTIFNGYVIGKTNDITKTINIPISPINISFTDIKSETLLINNNNNFIGSNILSTSIEGHYNILNSNGTEIIKINNNILSEGHFDIPLGVNLLDNVILTIESNMQTPIELELTDITYNITYDYAISSGLIASSNNTTFTNVINKGHIFGKVSAGISAYSEGNTSINSSYNIGNIDGSTVGGLIGIIDKNSSDVIISYSYNDATLNGNTNGGLINTISNSNNISIINSFYTNNLKPVDKILNTNILIDNSYQLYDNQIDNEKVIGSFKLTTLNNLTNADYVINNLLYSNFISLNDLSINPLNVWKCENESLPKLYIDDDNSIATIYASIYSWNILSEISNNIYLNDNITFSIEQSSIIKPIKNIYYYLSNSETLLTIEELNNINEWIIYDDVTVINTSGVYVIYTKVVDVNDNITYLNSDLLLLNMTPNISINVNNTSFNELKENFDYYYIDDNKEFSIIANDSISSSLNIKYMISNITYTKEELDSLDDNMWNNYTTSNIINEDKYIIYSKVTNMYDDIFYASTDYIILSGYTNSYLFLGRNNNYNSNNMTDKSSITTNYIYHSEYPLDNSYKHNLLSNIVLPVGTKIIIVDKIFNKAYYYEVSDDNDYGYNDSCNELDTCTKYATYPFALFMESGGVDKHYIENDYYQNNEVNENFDIIIDFNNASFDKNYQDIYFKLELVGNNSKITTLNNSLKTINIYNNVNNTSTNANLYLTSDYKGDSINYYNDSITSITFNAGISYKMIDKEEIIDTTFENKNIFLAIKMFNDKNELVSYDDLKNIYFEIDGIEYYPENDGITRINLNSGINNITKTLKIITKNTNVSLNEGTYYLKISNYASYNDEYNDMVSNNILSIPVVILNTITNNYGFDVIMNSNDRIINHDIVDKTISFNLKLSNLSNPKLYISLYKKDELTAYNQDYSLINIKDYIANNLEFENNSYIIPINENFTFDLLLNTTNLENNGYKYVFDLYDGDNKISSITKYFIVR